MNELINRGDKPTKSGFGEGLLEAGERVPELIGLGTDITSSVGMDLFTGAFPDRFISLGIAEQNAASVAAGLALSGKIPVFATYGVFAALRSADQIRVSICYNDLHVVIGGAHAGVSVGPDGATHQALEDIAIVRSLPNMVVLSPADATQTRIATLAAILESTKPVYIRFGREAMPDFTSPGQDFRIGMSQRIRDGKDLTIIATGHMVWEAVQAASALAVEGIDARVINMHTIKPLDEKAVIDSAKETGRIVTAEEHQVTGGLGGAVAETVVRYCPVPVTVIGMPDRFGESGKPRQLMEKFGLNASSIVKASRSLVR